MNIRNLRKSKKVLIGIVVLFVILIAAVFTIKILHKPTITTYKDEQFIIYECSQPIKAKEGTVPDLFGGRMDALVPADQNEANRYCKGTGVE